MISPLNSDVSVDMIKVFDIKRKGRKVFFDKYHCTIVLNDGRKVESTVAIESLIKLVEAVAPNKFPQTFSAYKKPELENCFKQYLYMIDESCYQDLPEPTEVLQRLFTQAMSS